MNLPGFLRNVGVLCAAFTTTTCGTDSTGPGNDNGNGSDDPGAIQVTAATSGVDVDPDGYTVNVGGSSENLAINSSVTLSGLAPGTFSVQLSGVADNCAVTEANPQQVTVTAGNTTNLTFTVVCSSLTASQDLADEAIDSLEVALFRAINDIDTATVGSGVLDRFSFERARSLFEQALAADPTNETAALGLAVTTIFVLEDDPDLRAFADQWDAWLEEHDLDELGGAAVLAAAEPLFWERATLPLSLSPGTLERLTDVRKITTTPFPIPADDGTFPPTLAEHQTVLRDVIEPALETALAALNGIDDPNFVFIITAAMQGEADGEADPLELDLTEVFALRAAVEAALGSIDLAVAYVLEPSPYGDGFATAFAQSSTFLTLASDGATRLGDLQQHIFNAVDRLQEGVNFLQAEVDDQSDDLIKIDPTGDEGIEPSDLQQLEDALADIEAALQGPRSVTEDFGNGSVTVTVNLSAFFTNPIQDLKALLPSYVISDGLFEWTAVSFDAWTFPDPTFSGILPDVGSDAELKNIFELDELYDDLAPRPDNITVTPSTITLAVGDEVPITVTASRNGVEIPEPDLFFQGTSDAALVHPQFDLNFNIIGWTVFGQVEGSDIITPMHERGLVSGGTVTPINVFVTATAAIARIEISGAASGNFACDCVPGTTVQLTATAFDASDDIIPGVAFNWSVIADPSTPPGHSDPSLWPIDQNGLITVGGEAGYLAYIAEADGVADTLGLVGAHVLPDDALITPTMTTLEVGQTVNLSADLTKGGVTVPGVSFNYSADAAGVVSFANGDCSDLDPCVVTAVAPGTVTIKILNASLSAIPFEIASATTTTITVVPAGGGVPMGWVHTDITNFDLGSASQQQYTPAADEGTNLAGGQIGVFRNDVGKYIVVFTGMGTDPGLLGDNFFFGVNANLFQVLSTPVHAALCNPVTFTTTSQLQIEVWCENINDGTALDANFRLLAIGDGVVGPPGGNAHAAFSFHHDFAATSDYTPLTEFSWNSLGGPMTVGITGEETIHSVGGSISGNTWVQAINPAVMGSNLMCNNRSVTQTTRTVWCFNAVGTMQRQQHTLLTLNEGRGNGITGHAHVAADGSLFAPGSFNSSGGAITTTKTGTGTYEITFDGLVSGTSPNFDGNFGVLVTPAGGAAWEACGHRVFNSNPIQVQVVCADVNGTTADPGAAFEILVIR